VLIAEFIETPSAVAQFKKKGKCPVHFSKETQDKALFLVGGAALGIAAAVGVSYLKQQSK
jgi:hypothetical protein